VDVGGTFTDVVVLDGSRPRAVKVPTTPEDQSEGVARGLEASTARHVGTMAHGTTTATNAVLERAVARTVLVTTAGFADVLAIGRQERPALYDLSIIKPQHLAAAVVTVRERVAADGTVLLALDDAEVARVVDAVAAAQPQAIAVSLLCSYAAEDHERRLCAALEARMAVPVTRSSALLPQFREYERASTCVLNAAVAPVMGRYLSRLETRLPDTRVSVMTSGGGTASIAEVAAAPVHTLLSGPAAGVVAAGAIARSAGFRAAVALDMGGTSTDVCLVRDGRPELSDRATIGGLPFATPAVAVHTVGAGGGSIAEIDAGGALAVGPRSAGARPGPACYGFGGTEPTVTDAHCALGHLAADRALGSGGEVRLDVDAARRALSRLPGGGAAGVLTVVQATMVRALRRVTTERGVDPADLALVAYGGAGPLHATALAEALGCAAVVIPPAPGVLSALGLLLAPPRHEASRTVLGHAAPDHDLEAVWEALAAEAALRVPGPVTATRWADCRYAGQSHELRVPAASRAEAAAAFARAHREAYGYDQPGEQVEVVALRAVAEGRPVLSAPPVAWDQGVAAAPRRRRASVPLFRGSKAGSKAGTGSEGRWREVDLDVVDRAGLSPGDILEGPALVEQHDATTLLSYGDRATVDDAGNLVVRRSAT